MVETRKKRDSGASSISSNSTGSSSSPAAAAASSSNNKAVRRHTPVDDATMQRHVRSSLQKLKNNKLEKSFAMVSSDFDVLLDEEGNPPSRSDIYHPFNRLLRTIIPETIMAKENCGGDAELKAKRTKALVEQLFVRRDKWVEEIRDMQPSNKMTASSKKTSPAPTTTTTKRKRASPREQVKETSVAPKSSTAGAQPTSGTKKKKLARVRCGTCVACLRKDCATCKCCVRKTKFGGDGSSKEACVHRRCVNLQERGAISDSNDKKPSQRRKRGAPKDDSSAPAAASQKPRIRPKRKRATHMYGLPIPKKPIASHEDDDDAVCAGCQGARNREAKDEPVLLCDGPGCGREYHMGCCVPPLTHIPEGAFYCEDCDAYGATVALHNYFEACAEARAEYVTSRDYVESLIETSLSQEAKEQGNNISNNESGSSSSKSRRKRSTSNRPRVPMSELWQINELHQQAVSDVDRFSTTQQQGKEEASSAVSDPSQPLGPDFLVGKPIRIYCPPTNSYQDGRIVDWRAATHLAGVGVSDAKSNKDRANAFHGRSQIASCEFLVRFPAGVNHRKQTLHCWIILEEHSLAVGVSLIWGQFQRKKGFPGWKAAQTWLRTTLELVPVSHLLDETDNQISYATEYDPSNGQGGPNAWALAKLIGEDVHALLDLRRESVDFFSASFASQRLQAMPNSPCESEALAFAESEEQKRIREWHAMPLKNPAHYNALTIVDEGALQPLHFPRRKKTNNAKDDKPLDGNAKADGEATNDDAGGPRLCPLIEQGLDRLWVMELMRDQGVERSLDTAASLSCQLVTCTPAAVAAIREERKQGAAGP